MFHGLMNKPVQGVFRYLLTLNLNTTAGAYPNPNGITLTVYINPSTDLDVCETQNKGSISQD